MSAATQLTASIIRNEVIRQVAERFFAGDVEKVRDIDTEIRQDDGSDLGSLRVKWRRQPVSQIFELKALELSLDDFGDQVVMPIVRVLYELLEPAPANGDR